MAIITEMLGEKVISGFKGVIDFYYYMGIAVVRKWPRKPSGKRSPEVKKGWPAFAWAAANWNSLSPSMQDAYRSTASGSALSGRDLFTKSYISSYFRKGQWLRRE